MSGMTDITEFIRARLDEDEAAALQDPHPEHSRPILSYIDYGEIEIGTARVLAQVAAMRAIVEFHGPPYILYGTAKWACLQCDSVGEEPPCLTLRHLAAIWSSHPDYDPAWVPDASST